MTQKAKETPYRTNPVELVIFFGITGLFSFSLYNLLYDRDQFQLANIQVEKNPVASTESTGDRSPASIAPSLFPLTLDCGKTPEQKTLARSARISIQLCRDEGGQLVKGGDVKLIREATVTNASNSTPPIIVFIDTNPLTTAPFPLNSGKNPLHIEYTYRDGQKISHDVVINKE